MTFHGLMTAIVTPFQKGALHEPTHRALVERQIEGGVQGLVPCGTTGEAPTLDLDEHNEVIRWTVEQTAGRVPVMAGIGSNNTATAIAPTITRKRTRRCVPRERDKRLLRQSEYSPAPNRPKT